MKLQSICAFVIHYFLLWNILSTIRQCHANNGYIEIDGRHSYSLSTFDSSGRLGQVYRASEAASLGPPLFLVCRPGQGVLMASPQVLPSPLVFDDGTARFARISSQILVAHSGLSADGRLLVAASQRIAVEHEYIYDEPIPMDIFLEEVSLLFQEYTMKPASRPFGATLVVAYLPEQHTNAMPQIYRVDPSGSVESLANYGVVNGDKMQSDETLLTELKSIAENSETTSLEEDRLAIMRSLEGALQRASEIIGAPKDTSQSTAKEANVLPSNLRRFLTASLTYKEGMNMERFDRQLSSNTDA